MCCNIVLYRVPLQPINPGRRTIEDIRESRRNIANRWGAVGYDELPEEPITNYMDVNFILISSKQFISTLDDLNYASCELYNIKYFRILGPILWSN